MATTQKTATVTGFDDQGKPVTVHFVIDINQNSDNQNDDDDDDDDDESGTDIWTWIVIIGIFAIGLSYYRGYWGIEQLQNRWQNLYSNVQTTQGVQLNMNEGPGPSPSQNDSVVLKLVPVAQTATATTPTQGDNTNYEGKLTNVVYKPTNQKLPALSWPFSCNKVSIRKPTSANNGLSNPWYVHGKRDYYALGLKSWYGIDLINACENPTMLALITGLAGANDFYLEDPDNPYGNGQAVCWIVGTGDYEGFVVRYLHMDPKDCFDGLDGIPVKWGQPFAKYDANPRANAPFAHAHIDVTYEGKAIPAEVLMPGLNIDIYLTGGGYVDGAMPSESQITQDFEIPYDPQYYPEEKEDKTS